MVTDQLLKALKVALRSRGISYKSAADSLGLSESSIKRLFADKSFTLPRLEKLCEIAQTDLGELIHMAESAGKQLESLTSAQEQEIVNNPKLLLVGVCLLNLCTFDEILNKYAIKETELIQCFAAFDRFNVIEYLPGNRYRLKLSRNFSWNSNGPIQRFFIESILNEYLETGMQGSSNHLHYVWGMLTRESAKQLVPRIQRLVDDYMQLAGKEARLPMSDKMTSSLFVLFREDWEPGIFKSQWKEQ